MFLQLELPRRSLTLTVYFACLYHRWYQQIFDPLGLANGTEVGDIKLWREAEIKHGRVAMLASLGVLVAEVRCIRRCSQMAIRRPRRFLFSNTTIPSSLERIVPAFPSVLARRMTQMYFPGDFSYAFRSAAIGNLGNGEATLFT